ncbi:E3 ubiquitin-protein ligase listerin [Neolecta irregularis DAH-3]|uniref:E3 ubiquitin-protein ligase listerin n=1 Tax=Neolecta irregularis (strain DAH-3) TaxID=1198029 RepID=A0A1U7LSN3_NEOID|nr:E3 ubiquitin-protein ligase listerin [Neolecta irregularis DAH-3]|eukprot:OLL25686.1 E3 ubiquitin-protein ligase listerin [Neolecta irregularis DAH-3]
MVKKDGRQKQKLAKPASSSRAQIGESPNPLLSSLLVSSSRSPTVELADFSKLPPELHVIFKNLTKKDAKTKSRALDEFSIWLENHRDYSEETSKTWFRVYNKLVIDVERTIRIRVHTVHGIVCRTAGKRASKYFNEFIGAWLTTTNEVDYGVSKAALESFKLVFPESRRTDVWKVFSGPILDYIVRIICFETEQTLSDEKYTTKQDAEAKYFRIVVSCLRTLCYMLGNVEDITPQYSNFVNELLSSKKLLQLALRPEGILKSQLFKFLQIILNSHRQLITSHCQTLAEEILAPCFKSPPLDSSVADFMGTVLLISKTIPEVWASLPSASRFPSRFSRLLKKASYGTGAEFWSSCSSLIPTLPLIVLPRDMKTTEAILEASWEGVNQEMIGHKFVALENYFTMAYWFHDNVLDDKKNCEVMSHFILSKLDVLLFTSSPIRENHHSVLFAKVIGVISQIRNGVLDLEWTHLAHRLQFAMMEGKSNEVCSPISLAESGQRFIDALTSFNNDALDSRRVELILGTLSTIRKQEGSTIDNIKILNAAVAQFPKAILKRPEIHSALQSFAQYEIPQLVSVGIAKLVTQIFINILEVYQHDPDASASLKPTLTLLLASEQTSEIVLNGLLNRSLKIIDSADIDAFVSQKLQKDNISTEDWNLICDIITCQDNSLIPDTINNTLSKLVAKLDSKTENSDVVDNTVDIISKMLKVNDRNLLEVVISNPVSVQIIMLSARYRSQGPLQEFGVSLNNALELIQKPILTLKFWADVFSQLKKALINVESEDHALELTDQAKYILDALSPELFSQVSCLAILQSDIWRTIYSLVMKDCSPSSIAVTDSLLLLPYSCDNTGEGTTPYDSFGYSAFFRVCTYTKELLTSFPTIMKHLETSTAALIIEYLLRASQIAIDQDHSGQDAGLWSGNELTGSSFLHEFSQKITKIISSILQKSESKSDQWILDILQRRIEPKDIPDHLLSSLVMSTQNHSYTGLLSARVLRSVLNTCTADRTHNYLNVLENFDFRRPTNAFLQASLLSACLKPSQYLNKLENELVSDISGSCDSRDFTTKLVFLNIVLAEQEISAVPQPRRIVLLKKVLSMGSHNTIVARLVVQMVRGVDSICGQHWDLIFHCLQQWIQTCIDGPKHTLPLRYAVLKLVGILKSIYIKNDDLEDLWNDGLPKIEHKLVTMLIQTRDFTSLIEQHCNDALVQTLDLVRPDKLSEDDYLELYGLVTLPKHSPFQKTFNILETQIRSHNSDLVVQLALNEDVNASIPGQLLSLLIHPSDGWEAAWFLLFFFFDKISSNLRSRYLEILRNGSYVDLLMTTLCSLFELDTDRPYSPTHDVLNVSIWNWNGDEKKLGVRLYTEAMIRIGSLIRGWWSDCKSRGLTVSVEKFTERHISPLVIEHELDAVRRALDQYSFEENLLVQIRKAEVSAIYHLDEHYMAMQMSLPPQYPLLHIEVSGPQRVGVKESQWRAWLLASQGMITSQSGSIIDALSLFEKNVRLHFEVLMHEWYPERNAPNVGECSTPGVFISGSKVLMLPLALFVEVIFLLPVVFCTCDFPLSLRDSYLARFPKSNSPHVNIFEYDLWAHEGHVVSEKTS